MRVMYRKAAGAALAGALLCGTAACTTESRPAAGNKAGQKPLQVTPAAAAAVKRAAEKNEKLTSLTYTMSGKVPDGGSVEARASMSIKPPAMQMSMRGGTAGETGEVEIRLVDGAMYMNGGKEAAAEMDGKSWLKFDLSALGKGSAGADPLGGLSDQADRNPAQDSASLTAAKDLRKVGEETVDGVRTTHYAGTVTIAAMRASLKGQDAATEERREKGLKQYESMGVDALTMDMWVDENDHTKQFRTRGAADKGPLDLTIKFLDYNKPVTVKAPPASETLDLAEMMKNASDGT
ncbi:DUF1396 domain-containing protein [Streptomyces sp. A3M-1-3]|uniref:DUF1396 domain-containing protein n=1 Tax=Streptomyces sp. A3M-1-3 TaxID=2962044 RepID=UPI0020B88875|nr:DUF1396 domain-containing protein [Streptomyces sp. A3M-1-3]MCP3819843.1 DUF1396 domain-containing protein [Streptomyces sp. A3M-1-3]